MTEPPDLLELSIVTPAHDERDNVRALVEQIDSAISPLGFSYEIIVVDDASTDDTLEVLRSLQKDNRHLRIVHLEPPAHGTSNGQSAAFKMGFEASVGRLIATMDADLQNDPEDLPRLLSRLKESGADMVQGDRSRNRRDSLMRRLGSSVGRLSRRLLLGDSIRDTGCSLRIMKRETAMALPLEYRGLHRFIPFMARQMGYTVIETPVTHRPRRAGRSKYGIFNRAPSGLIDCLVVRWMRARRSSVSSSLLEPSQVGSDEIVRIEIKPDTSDETVRS